MYQNYIFDFYGTVTTIKTDEDSLDRWQKLSLFMGYHGASYTDEALRDAFRKYTKKYLSRRIETDYPDIDIEDVFYRLYKEAGVKPNPKIVRSTLRHFRAVTTDKIELHKPVIDFITKLKKQDKKIYLLDNGQRNFLMPELKMFKLKKLFDGIYISSDFGMKKPDVRLLETLLSENNLKTKETILVGNDYTEDIKMARKAGIDCLYIHTETSNRKVKDEKAKYTVMDGDFSKISELIG